MKNFNAQSAKDIVKKSKNKKNKGIGKILKLVLKEIKKAAKNSKTELSINVNSYVKEHMSSDTQYDDVSDSLVSSLETKGFTTKPFSEYKECSLKINW